MLAKCGWKLMSVRGKATTLLVAPACWAYAVFAALKWPFRLCLGDHVTYRGEAWQLYQGVADPRWHLIRLRDRKTERWVHRREFRKMRTPANYWHDFSSGYRFYMSCWHSIWVNQCLERVFGSKWIVAACQST